MEANKKAMREAAATKKRRRRIVKRNNIFAGEDTLHTAFVEHCNKCDCPMGCDHRKNPRFLLDGNCASIMKCFARFVVNALKRGGAK